MTKRVLVFDLDGTLTPSKARMEAPMASALRDALDMFYVCVISGGAFKRFEKQLLTSLSLNNEQLAKLYLMPTCGTQCYQYDLAAESWRRTYADTLGEDEKKHIIAGLTGAVERLGYDQTHTYGELIEDRETQVTYSALGQDVVDVLGEEGLRRKADWDPDDTKKQQLVDIAAKSLRGYEVRISSPTSIDVTKPGMDKSFGVKQLLSMLDIKKKCVLFMGDRLEPGGNDYPVKRFGVDCIPVANWQETVRVLERILESKQPAEE